MIAAALRIAKAVYPYAVFGYELVRAEILKSSEPPPMPLSFRDAQRMNEAAHQDFHAPKK